MAACELNFESSRDLVLGAIVRSLKSWPELQRKIFMETHYGGRSPEDIAHELDMRQSDVARILQLCERELHQALKAFREDAPSDLSKEPPHPLARKAACCFR